MPSASTTRAMKTTGTGNADFCAWLGTPLPWIRTQTKKVKRYECRARPPRSHRNSSHPWPATTQCPVWERLFLTDVLSTAPGSSGFFYHVVISTDNLDFRLWSVFLRNKNIPFYFKYDRFRKKSFSHIKKWAWQVLPDSFFSRSFRSVPYVFVVVHLLKY